MIFLFCLSRDFILFFFLSKSDVLQAAAGSLVNELEEYINESFVSSCFHSLHGCSCLCVDCYGRADCKRIKLALFIPLAQRESSVTVLEGVDATQTNMSFFRQQLQRIATHILRCQGNF